MAMLCEQVSKDVRRRHQNLSRSDFDILAAPNNSEGLVDRVLPGAESFGSVGPQIGDELLCSCL